MIISIRSTEQGALERLSNSRGLIIKVGNNLGILHICIDYNTTLKAFEI